MKKICVAVFMAVLLTSFAVADALSRENIPAKAAVVMDSSGTILYAKYPDAKLAPASTVKLVTAMVVLDRLDLSATVRVSRNAGRTRSIRPRLREDEEMTAADLLHLALMKSVNSSAVALAEATAGSEQAFVALMNDKVREIGAHNTLFANASGLPKGLQYTTAGDLALIMKAALSYRQIRDVLGKRMYVIRTSEGRDILVENSNDLLWHTDNMIGGKTGYTGNARHCFVGAVNTDNGLLITAVLGARSRSSLWKSARILTEIGVQKKASPLTAKLTGVRLIDLVTHQ